MFDHTGKMKPELWKEIEALEQRITLLEQYLENKGLLSEALEYVEECIFEQEELPF